MRLLAPEHPNNLAALRISVAAILLLSPETYSAPRIASIPSALRAPPEGLVWAASVLPITPGAARAAQFLLVGSAVTGLIGLCSRTSLAVVTLSALYVFGVYQLTGSVTHDMHLVWFSALLAVGPSGEALSVDRWLARRRGAPDPTPSLDVAVPLLFVRALFGAIYFFPGFWKMREAGWSWIWSDNLQNQMYWKWYQNGLLPPFRIDHYGGLVRAGALGVVLFELSFPLFVLFRKSRPLAAAGGVAFHLLTQAFLFIPFVSLWGCYSALIDWGHFAKAERRFDPSTSPRGTEKPRSVRRTATWVLGAVLLALASIQGARSAMQAWPFACYPTFQWKVGPTIPDVVMEAVRADGATRVLPDGPGAGGSRTPEQWAMAWRIAGLYGDQASAERFHAYLRQAERKPGVLAEAKGAARIRFYRAWYSVVPEDAGRPPLRAELIGELRMK